MAEWADLARLRLLGVVAVLCASTAIQPLISGRLWWVETATLICVAAVVNFGVSLRLGQGVGSIAGAIAAVLSLNAIFGSGPLPTPESLSRLWEQLRTGAQAVYALPPPIPDDPGSRALVVIGVAFAWWFVDLLVGATATPAAAGVPLLAILIPAATISNYGIPWWSFVLAAVGYLLLLMGSEGVSLRDVGRLVGPRGRQRPSWGSEGLPVLAGAVAVAVLVPALLPGLATRVLPPDAFAHDDTIAVLNPILDLRDDLRSRSDAPILSYTTTAPRPQPLRVLTVDDFDGRVWQPTYGGRLDRGNRVQQRLPTAPGLAADVPRQSVETTITIDRLRQTWLPTPYPPTRIDIEGNWLWEPGTFNVVGDQTTTQPGQTYVVDHELINPAISTLEQAPDWADRERYTRLPGNLPPEIRQIALQVAGTGSNYDRAMRIQTWLRSDGGFVYDEDAPPQTSSAAILDFLRDKHGYCVHFASAMAVMARVLDIPARIGVGFTVGQDDGNGTWVVREQNAHAWPELYFEGVGWVRFEPTPATHIPSLPTWATPATEQPTDTATTTSTTSSTSAAPTQTTAVPTQTTATTPSLAERVGGLLRSVSWPLVVVIVAVLVMLALPALSARAARRRRWRTADSPGARAEASWQELLDELEDLGTPAAPSATVQQVADQVRTELDPTAARSLTLLAHRVELSRYAPDLEPETEQADDRADLGRVLRSLRGERGPVTSARARLLPRSGLRRLLGWRRRGAEGYADWLRRRSGRYRNGR